MSLSGQRARPTGGIKGSKPIPGGRRRLAKMEAPPVDTEELKRESSIYLKERNRAMRLKRMREEMLLAEARGELIQKKLVELQLTYLLVAMRQKLLAIPAKLYSRFGPERFPRETAQECERFIHEVLDELAKLPECAEPDWLEKLEEKEV